MMMQSFTNEDSVLVANVAVSSSAVRFESIDSCTTISYTVLN